MISAWKDQEGAFGPLLSTEGLGQMSQLCPSMG